MNKNGKKLDTYCHISSGGTPSRRKPEFYGGDILWSTIADMEKSDGIVVDTKEKITPEGLASIGNRLFSKNTLLLAMYGSVGKVAITGNEMATNQAILGITPKNEKEIYLPYLKYWLMANKRQIVKKARGGILKNLSAKIVRNLKIKLPLYDDQIKIANLLSQVEALIAKRKESINLLDELLKSTFLDMFGDPVLNTKGWDKKTCIDVASCIVPGRDKPKSFTGTTPWITTGDLNHKSFIELEENYIGLSEEEISDVKAKIIPKESVIFTCVGDLGVVSINNENIIMNQQLHSFQCSDKVNNIFMMFNLSFEKQFMYKYASKTTVPYMNKTTCNKIPIILPPKPLQDKFATIVQQVEESKKKYQESLNELHQLFGSLSQRAFKGELDLSGVEEISVNPNEDKSLVEIAIPQGLPEFTRKQIEALKKSLNLGETMKQISSSAKLFKSLNIPSFKIDTPPLNVQIPHIDTESFKIFQTSQQLMESMQKRKEHVLQMLEDIPQIKQAIEEDVLCKDDFLDVTLRFDYEYAEIKRIIMDKLASNEIVQYFDEEKKRIKLGKAT